MLYFIIQTKLRLLYLEKHFDDKNRISLFYYDITLFRENFQVTRII